MSLDSMSDNNAYRAEMEDGDERDRPMPGFGSIERQQAPPEPIGREIGESDESVNLFHDVFRDNDPINSIIVKYSFKFFAVIAIFSFIGSCIGSFIAYNIFKG